MASIYPWFRPSEILPCNGSTVLFITPDYVAHYGTYSKGSWSAWALEFAKPPQIEIDGN